MKAPFKSQLWLGAGRYVYDVMCVCARAPVVVTEQPLCLSSLRLCLKQGLSLTTVCVNEAVADR